MNASFGFSSAIYEDSVDGYFNIVSASSVGMSLRSTDSSIEMISYSSLFFNADNQNNVLGDIVFNIAGSQKAIITNIGNFGIGNSATGTEILQVTGNTKLTGTLQVTGSIFTALTTGSIPFINSSGLLTQDNSNLFWNNTTKRLGIGTVTPAAELNIEKSVGSSGGVGATIKNTNSGGESFIALRNDLSYYAAFELFGSGFSAGSLQNQALFTASSGITKLGFATLSTTPITFSVNGATNEIARFTSTGLGIGNTNPTYKLDLTVSATSDGVRVQNTLSTGLATFVATNNSGAAGSASYGVSGSSYATYGALAASNTILYSTLDMVFMADAASKVIKFAAGGNTEIARISSGGLGVTGSLTVSTLSIGYLPKAGTGGLLSNSAIYDNSTKIGIGNTAISIDNEKLQVTGDTLLTGNLKVTGSAKFAYATKISTSILTLSEQSIEVTAVSTITLPLPSSSNIGKEFIIKNNI